MPKQLTNNQSNVWDYFSLVSASLFIIFLILNIYHRVLIIDILYEKSFGSVPYDAPVQYPLIVGLITSGISLYVSKRKTSTLWAIATTMLLVGLLIWVFGLRHAFKN